MKYSLLFGKAIRNGITKITEFNKKSRGRLSDDPGRELRISVMWRSLSEEEKRSLWSNTFERDEPTTFIPLKKAAF